MLSNHPYFEVSAVTGNESAGKEYGDAVKSNTEFNLDEKHQNLVMERTKPESLDVDLVFSLSRQRAIK